MLFLYAPFRRGIILNWFLVILTIQIRRSGQDRIGEYVCGMRWNVVICGGYVMWWRWYAVCHATQEQANELP